MRFDILLHETPVARIFVMFCIGDKRGRAFRKVAYGFANIRKIQKIYTVQIAVEYDFLDEVFFHALVRFLRPFPFVDNWSLGQCQLVFLPEFLP